MSNKIQQEMSQIEIPKELSERSKLGVKMAKSEMRPKNRYRSAGVAVAAALIISAGTYTYFHKDTPTRINQEASGTRSVNIPAVQMHHQGAASTRMIGLIVYNGKIYTITGTSISAEDAKSLIGEKLGTTKDTIDEWNQKQTIGRDFASTVGITDVYSVKGYDTNFRIMTYQEIEGQIYAEFYENLNGITISSGEDVFGKFNMAGNVTAAQYRTFDDWNSGVENYHPIADMETVNSFIEVLNKAEPHLRGQDSDPLVDNLTSETYRELTISLKDGSKVKLTLLKGGYVYYGFMDAYFKVDEDAFTKMWGLLE